MACFGIAFSSCARETLCCLCGKPTVCAGGPVLISAQSSAAVCRKCGKERAPRLTALVTLAQVAERVGRIKRHILVPPLEALLELAEAAEDYVSSASPLRHAASGSEQLEEVSC
jgi:hypothetical protein